MIHSQSDLDNTIFYKEFYFHNFIVFVMIESIQVECLMTKLFSFMNNFIKFSFISIRGYALPLRKSLKRIEY